MNNGDPLSPWKERPPHLQRWTDPRTGKQRIYFRMPHCRRVAPQAPWGSQALADEVAALIAAAPERQRPDDVTLVGAVRAYRGDRRLGIDPADDYASLVLTTKLKYDLWLDDFEEKFAGLLLSDVNALFVLKLKNKWAKRGFEAANTGLRLLTRICKPGMISGEIEGNPFEHIGRVRRPHDYGIANPSALDVEIDAMLEATLTKSPGLARAIALMRYGGFRPMGARTIPLRARIERTAGDGALERRIYWVTEKKQVLCDRREDQRLTSVLDATPSRALTIAYNGDGHPFENRRAFNQQFDRLITRLAAKGKVRPGLTPHGLRHARGVEIAYAGGADSEIQASLDHTTSAAAKIYRAQADKVRLADHAQDRIDKQVAHIDAAQEKRRQHEEP